MTQVTLVKLQRLNMQPGDMVLVRDIFGMSCVVYLCGSYDGDIRWYNFMTDEGIVKFGYDVFSGCIISRFADAY